MTLEKMIEESDLFEIAAILRKEINALPEWQKTLIEGEIRRIKEREEILREIGKYEYSRVVTIGSA